MLFRSIILLLTTTLVTFMVLIYSPNFFGSQSTLWLYISRIVVWNNFPLSLNIWVNHSVYSIASFFTDCVNKNTCDTQPANIIMALSLLFLTFIIPLLLVKPVNRIAVNKNIFSSFLKLRKDKELALVLFVLSVAFINLSFKIVYDYRLFFSIPITLILLRETAKIKNALVYCYLSIFSLFLGGMWIMKFGALDFGIIDARFLKLFFVLHFFFLILSALTYWKESQVKSVMNPKRIKSAPHA